MALFSSKTWGDWVDEYALAHQHPINRLCHRYGIPMIVISLFVAVLAIFFSFLWLAAIALFISGWVLQFVGHYYEGKLPEFFRDPRFLIVGLRWWLKHR